MQHLIQVNKMLYKMKLSFCQVFLVFAAGFIRKCHLKLSALQKRIKIFSFQGDDIAYTDVSLAGAVIWKLYKH